jgi:hypothetical protein
MTNKVVGLQKNKYKFTYEQTNDFCNIPCIFGNHCLL